MKRSQLMALLASTAIGASVLTFGLMATAADEKAADKPAKTTESAKPAAAKVTEDYVVVRYNGKEIRKSEIKSLWQAMFPEKDAPEFESFEESVRVELLRNVVRERIILDKAYAANVDKTEAVKDMLENAKRQIVIQAYLKSQIDQLVPEKDVKKQYDLLIEKNKGKQEVHARHILVETEEEAKKILKEIKDGGDFEKIAKEKSVDTGSGTQGGDLGYFTKERMVPEFAEAAFKMKKGEISEPVKTDFGWHIIKIEDTRAVKPPAFAEVKEEIRKSIAGSAVEKYVRSVIDGLDIKFFGPDGKELKPAPAEKAAPNVAPKADAPNTDAQPKTEEKPKAE